jgi:hypothetical protein
MVRLKQILFIPAILLVFCCNLGAQSVIGMSKTGVEELVKKEHREFRRDNTVVRQQFNYLKFVNGLKTRTWIIYFNEEDICRSSKLVCDYSEYEDVTGQLSRTCRKVGESLWEYDQPGGDTIRVEVIRQEWYFSVRETKKG